ncbi:MAG: hypothetical protein K2Y32_00395 [Candidatus Obscuribacterales bacterium]|nr:hypothetical protein [Candidatus Obscuribacterales bacterium]
MLTVLTIVLLILVCLKLLSIPLWCCFIPMAIELIPLGIIWLFSIIFIVVNKKKWGG